MMFQNQSTLDWQKQVLKGLSKPLQIYQKHLQIQSELLMLIFCKLVSRFNEKNYLMQKQV